MSDDAHPPDPDDFAIPSLGEIEEMRQTYDMSMAEMSRRAGFERDRWSYIRRGDVDPHLSTVRAYLEALQEADPDGFRVKRGQPPASEEEPNTHDSLTKRLETKDANAVSAGEADE